MFNKNFFIHNTLFKTNKKLVLLIFMHFNYYHNLILFMDFHKINL